MPVITSNPSSPNAFTHRPARSFAMDIGKPSPGKAGGAASAKRSRGIAVPSLSNGRGVQTMGKPGKALP